MVEEVPPLTAEIGCSLGTRGKASKCSNQYNFGHMTATEVFDSSIFQVNLSNKDTASPCGQLSSWASAHILV